MRTLYLSSVELERINGIAGPPPDPVAGTRAEFRRFRRAIIRAVGEVCGKSAKEYIRDEKRVRVEIFEDPNTPPGVNAAAVWRDVMREALNQGGGDLAAAIEKDLRLADATLPHHAEGTLEPIPISTEEEDKTARERLGIEVVSPLPDRP